MATRLAPETDRGHTMTLAEKIEAQRAAIRQARAALNLPDDANTHRLDDCFVRWYADGKRHSVTGCTVDVTGNLATVYRPNDPAGSGLRFRLGADGFLVSVP